jgi:hypothetical protein
LRLFSVVMRCLPSRADAQAEQYCAQGGRWRRTPLRTGRIRSRDIVQRELYALSSSFLLLLFVFSFHFMSFFFLFPESTMILTL